MHTTQFSSKKFLTQITAVLMIVMLMLTLVTPAYAATAGPNNAGAGANVNGPGSIAWANPGFITADDTNYATAVLTGNATSDYIQGTNYGFAIPATATINGIQVSIMRQSSSNAAGNSINDVDLNLLKAGVIVGTDHAVGTDWPTTITAANYGGVADLWGTTWTPAEINAGGFGVSLSVLNQSGLGRTASIDYIQVTITYTLPTTTVGDGTSPANKSVSGSETNRAVSAFTLSTNMGSDTVTGLVVTGTNLMAKRCHCHDLSICQQRVGGWRHSDRGSCACR